MILLTLGIIIFFSVHFIPATKLKGLLIEKLGELAYKGVFSIIAGVGLGLIIYGKSIAGFIEVWQPINGGQWLTVILTLPVFILISWSHIPGNMKHKLGHPMLIGISLFSAGHLISNGDLASVLLFGSFFIYSIVTMYRLYKPTTEKNDVLSANTWDAAGVVIGGGLYLLAFMFHFQFTGMVIPLN